MLVRLVLLSDTHGLHWKISIPDGDVLVHAGDFRGEGEAVEARSFGAFLRGLPHPNKAVISGNHDRSLEADPSLGPEVLPRRQLLVVLQRRPASSRARLREPLLVSRRHRCVEGSESSHENGQQVTSRPLRAVRGHDSWGSQALSVRVRIEDHQGDCHARVPHLAEQPGAEDDMRAWLGTMERNWKPHEQSHRRLGTQWSGERRQRRARLALDNVTVSQCWTACRTDAGARHRKCR